MILFIAVFALALISGCSNNAPAASSGAPASASPDAAVSPASSASPASSEAASKPAEIKPFAEKRTLNVLNWGEYMDDSLRAKFEKEYNVTVNYNTCTSNEQMYTVVSTEDSSADIIFPSDYMVERLIREGLLLEVDYNSLPNFKNVSDFCKNKNFDPGNKYSVPYTWGTLGILYNKKMVTDPVKSWSILWNEKYKDNIYMYDSMRDSMAVALIKLGYSINTTNQDEINAAGKALMDQKPLVKAYGTDDIKQSLLSGSGALGVVYSGDAMIAFEDDKDGVLDYAVPEEGSNIWFDNMVIMKNSKNVDVAEAFINFFLDPENSKANSESIGYPSSVSDAMKNLSDEYKNNPAFNPPEATLNRCEVYADVTSDEAVKSLYEDLWDQVKAG